MGVKRDVNAFIGNSLLQHVNEIIGTTKQIIKHQQHWTIADPYAIHWLSALAFQRALQRGSYKRLNCDVDRDVDRDLDTTYEHFKHFPSIFPSIFSSLFDSKWTFSPYITLLFSLNESLIVLLIVNRVETKYTKWKSYDVYS